MRYGNSFDRDVQTLRRIGWPEDQLEEGLIKLRSLRDSEWYVGQALHDMQNLVERED